MRKAPTAETIGRKLAAVREAAGKTQADIAALLGVSVPLVSQYERGLREPGTVLLWRFSRALGVSIDTLVS